MPKHKRPAPKQHAHSITKDSLAPRRTYKYVTGKRKPVAVRVDEGLYLRFKPLAKAIYGSVCRAVEVYMVSLIELAENPANICNTEGKPIHVSKIVIARNLRSRRALAVDEADECGFAGCHEIGVASGVWRSKTELLLCEKHLAEAENNSREWKVLPRKGEAHG